MEFRLRVFDHRVEACFSDSGRPYVATPSRHDSEWSDLESLAESGRGIALAQAVVDSLRYERDASGTNHWCLVKRWR
jgi:anti-sigma regulatory factor (Ser/Thr protein kinase)